MTTDSNITPRKVIEDFSALAPLHPNLSTTSDVKLIAYYLPQFHPIPENDEWWGKGFTEWTNVVKAIPYFDGHYQPHLPSEFGFYDLRLPEARQQQADLAREYGIHGFCYYYYWFSGRRLLEYPLQEVFASGKPDLPFCICWANENWSRRWDGSEAEILVEQVHNEETDVAFINDVIPLFKDERYIRLNGAPLLIIYKLSLLPNPARTAAKWREICAAQGIPRIHLSLAETSSLAAEPNYFGFDSAVQFPPHGVVAPLENENIQSLVKDYEGNIHDIRKVISEQITRPAPPYKRFPGVMTAWDNTSRKKKAGNIFINSSPETHELWTRAAIDQARERLPEGERLVFINAWNEWAEGAHLEPDQRYGRAYLEATRRALLGAMHWRDVITYADKIENLSGQQKDWILTSLRTRLEKQDIVNQHLMEHFDREEALPYRVVAQRGTPHWMSSFPSVEGGGFACIDQLNAHYTPVPPKVWAATRQKLLVAGWSFCPPLTMEHDTISYLIFLPQTAGADPYFAIIPERLGRSDVEGHFSLMPKEHTRYSGFRYYLDISVIAPGPYRLLVAHRGNNITHLTSFNQELELD